MTSDLLLYLKYFNSTDGIDIKFERSQPYPPLKQLICILHPENSNLLPQPYANLLNDPESSLRSPRDFYPSEFSIDPFGAVWEHEYIANIPFVSESIINEAYDKVDSKQLSEIDQ